MPVRPALLAIIITLATLKAQGQPAEVKYLIDTTITIMQKHAVNRGKVNWQQARAEAYKLAAGITDASQMGPAMKSLYQALGDFHGAFFYKDSTYKWTSKEPEVNDSMKAEWKKGVRIKTQLLSPSIGYLRIPFMPYGGRQDSDKKAQQLNDSLCSLLEQNIKGLVIDLRLNGGGAMYPMILGLEPLLTPGKLGTFIGLENSGWYTRDHKFYLDTAIVAAISPRCTLPATQIPIVFLVSPATGSSAEFLLISFKTRPATIQLGSETAGYVTSTEGFPINDSAFALLSTSYGSDRSGKIYKQAIPPDIRVNGIDKFNDLLNDVKVQRAMEWLNRKIKK
jgi:C-terminal processing protease CtpA/Prc